VHMSHDISAELQTDIQNLNDTTPEFKTTHLKEPLMSLCYVGSRCRGKG
jgi:hypothetical protein